MTGLEELTNRGHFQSKYSLYMYVTHLKKVDLWQREN